MNCKNCLHEKKCKKKKDTRKECPFYIDYADSEKFKKLDLLMRTNKGVQF